MLIDQHVWFNPLAFHTVLLVVLFGQFVGDQIELIDIKEFLINPLGPLKIFMLFGVASIFGVSCLFFFIMFNQAY